MKKFLIILSISLIGIFCLHKVFGGSPRQKSSEQCCKMVCQSCAMPLCNNEKMCGTDKNNELNCTYCVYCYQNGEFTNPNITLEEMIEKVVSISVERNIFKTKENAKIWAENTLPNLDRWKN